MDRVPVIPFSITPFTVPLVSNPSTSSTLSKAFLTFFTPRSDIVVPVTASVTLVTNFTTSIALSNLIVKLLLIVCMYTSVFF